MTRTKKPSGRKALFDKGRRERDYGRPPVTRAPQRLILILCEGSQTEPNYLNALKAARRLRTVQVRVIPGGEGMTDPLNLVKAAQREKRDADCNEDDQVWCVFDTEGKESGRSLEDARDCARTHGLCLAVSNPAFEYWYLLHFEATDRPFHDANEVVAALRQHVPRYDKDMAVFACLGDKTDTALANAQQLRARDEQRWQCWGNPSTGVDLLVQEIWKLGVGV
jgi:hypothetical protein